MSTLIEQNQKNKAGIKLFFTFLCDSIMLIGSMLLSLILTKNFENDYNLYLWMVMNILFMSIAFLCFNLYSYMYTYSGILTFIKIIVACLLLLGFNHLYVLLFDKVGFTCCEICCAVFAGLVIMTRLLSKLAIKKVSEQEREETISTKIMVVGASKKGTAIIRQMKNSEKLRILPIWVVDDDPSLTGKMLFGAEIVGTTEKLEEFIHKFAITNIIIAVNYQDQAKNDALLARCQKTKCKVQGLPAPAAKKGE